MNTLHSLRHLLDSEEGQDLVEYALVVALLALGAISGMHFLAGGINNAFSELAATVTSNIS
jgi:pilus assembly protein Flp/PilA